MTEIPVSPSPPILTTEDVQRIKAVFPSEMLERRQWVPYSAKWSDSLGKFDKIPLNPNTGYNAKSNDPKTWGTFDLAVKRALNRKMAGVGFVFSKDDPFVGIDLDKCVNGSGKVEPWASEIIQQLDSFTESSPSGEGYHILGRGRLPAGGRRTGQIEMYDSGRFFTVTGIVAGPGTLRDIQSDLDVLHAKLFKKAESKGSNWASPGSDRSPPDLTDDQIVERATKAANGAKFEALWRGDWPSLNYPSQSEADQALCDLLGWWVNYDAARLDGLFRQSGLFRPEKWDTPHFSGGQTYGGATIEKAVAGHSPDEGYKPAESARTRRAPFSPGERPTIVVNRQLAQVLDDVWELVHATNRRQGGPFLFQRSGQLVRVRQADDMSPYISLMSKESTTTYLIERADWVTRSDKLIRPSKPHAEIVAALICDPDPHLPHLSLVAHAPFFSQDGRLVASDGYHSEMRTWLKLSPDLQGTSVPDRPTAKDVKAAISLFTDDLLIDFPFANQSDRANCIGAFLLPSVRNMISDVTPLHLFEAPTPGSGKGLLASLLSIVASGDEAVVQVFPYQEDELRKRLSSELLKGRSVIVFDNADSKRTLDSATLAAMLTATVWGDRELGKIGDVTLRNNSIWVMTGNNLSLSSELADRTVRIRIDPKSERPRERDPRSFKHHPLKAWVKSHRRELIVAALTLTQSWIQAGKTFSGKEYGSFERWSHVIGGILEHAGVGGFMANRAEFFESADADIKMWHDFVKIWWERFGDQAVQAKQLNNLCEEHELMMQVRRDGTERSQVTILGNALRRARDSIKGEFRVQTDVYVVNAAGSHRNNGYRLVKADDQVGTYQTASGELDLAASQDIDLAALSEETPF